MSILIYKAEEPGSDAEYVTHINGHSHHAQHMALLAHLAASNIGICAEDDADNLAIGRYCFADHALARFIVVEVDEARGHRHVEWLGEFQWVELPTDVRIGGD